MLIYSIWALQQRGLDGYPYDLFKQINKVKIVTVIKGPSF